MLDIDKEVERVRQELADERKRKREQDDNRSFDKTGGNIDQTGRDARSNSFGNDRTVRSDDRNGEGSYRASSEGDGAKSDLSNSINEKSGTIRSESRRHGKIDSSTDEIATVLRATSRRSIGRLTRDDDIPTRAKRKTAKTIEKQQSVSESTTTKEEASKSIQTGETYRQIRKRFAEAKRAFKQEGTKLSASEATSIEEEFRYALANNCQLLDEVIWYYTGDTSHEPIWSSISDEELDILCRPILKTGQKSAWVAGLVRANINSSMYIDMGRITLPRIMRTVQKIKTAPKRERLSFMQRKRMMKEQSI